MGMAQLILNASRLIREEVASMEVDILVGESMAELLDRSKVQVESNMKELQLAATMASGECHVTFNLM